MEREENLILAIITQAIEDAKYDGHNKKMLKHKASATKWIMDYDPQFQTRTNDIYKQTERNIQW